MFRKIQNSDFYQKYKYSTYTSFHPFDGFWDIKRAGKGNMAVALTILGLFTVLYAIRAQFSGYIVTDTVSSEVNVLFECLTILLPLGFYVVSNWCFTTLMDGEGSLKDVFIAICAFGSAAFASLSNPDCGRGNVLSVFGCHLLDMGVGIAVLRYDHNPRLQPVQRIFNIDLHCDRYLFDFVHRIAFH